MGDKCVRHCPPPGFEGPVPFQPSCSNLFCMLPYTPTDPECCAGSHIHNACASNIILSFGTLTSTLLMNESALAELRVALSVELHLSCMMLDTARQPVTFMYLSHAGQLRNCLTLDVDAAVNNRNCCTEGDISSHQAMLQVCHPISTQMYTAPFSF